jgi:C-terminal processing protease CtpA/Prc
MRTFKATLLAVAFAVAGLATIAGALAQNAKGTGATSPPPVSAQCYIGVGVTLSLMGLQAWEMKNPDAVTIELLKPLTVMSVSPGSPAEQAQLYRGDKIVSINGVSTTGMTIVQAIALIDSGAPGSSLTLTIHRDGNHIQKDVSLTRSAICP